ncbi:hypothetical protein FVE85_0097 [Porphyridium purpureum]|uniref:Uncharacterized protein n=1 Tax=Porphyridium purpureum TaxID=35688 RepID=A0A5J4YZ31_PORPP|nr:hypothetical protein FVE85_0097 [Porphyridium purpureum]|eukprot:POR1018..scf208_2
MPMTAAPRVTGTPQRVRNGAPTAAARRTSTVAIMDQCDENAPALANHATDHVTPEKRDTMTRLPDRSPAQTPRRTNLSMTPSRVVVKTGHGNTPRALRSPAKRVYTPLRPSSVAKDDLSRSEPVGSVLTYAQVRASSSQRNDLGVDTLVSPVRHCSRNRTPGREVNPDVQRLLSQNNFAYSPNKALDHANLQKTVSVRSATPSKLAQDQGPKARKVLEFGE